MNQQILLEGIGLFLLLSGLILGLGGVTVIDIHGFLGRTSAYWTEATVRTHKVTKPLIWLGIILFVIGSCIYSREHLFSTYHFWQVLLSLLLIGNGFFLSFVVSPYLLNQEKKGKADSLLPDKLQKKIMVSFLFSFFGWWSQVLLLIFILIQKI